MRQGQQQQQQNRRNRGRSRKPQNPLTRSYESNGPDVKIRGTAAHIAEKYMSLARDAASSGDIVMSESYLQHAEHYNRIILAAQPQPNGHDVSQPRSRKQSGADLADQPSISDDNDDDPIPLVAQPNAEQPEIPDESASSRQQNAGDNGDGEGQPRTRRRRQRPSPGQNDRDGGTQREKRASRSETASSDQAETGETVGTTGSDHSENSDSVEAKRGAHRRSANGGNGHAASSAEGEHEPLQPSLSLEGHPTGSNDDQPTAASNDVAVAG